MLVTQSGQTLEKIVASVKKVSDIVAEIAAASREQSSGIEQVNRAVMQMDELTQQNAALVEEATAASQAMAEQVRGLNEMLARYRVAEAALTRQRQRCRSTPAGRRQQPARAGAARPSGAAALGPGPRQSGQVRQPPTAASGCDAVAAPRQAVARATGNGADTDWREF